MKHCSSFFAACAAIIAAGVGALCVGAPTIPWSTVDSGGGVSTAGPYRLSSTIGQPDAGATMSGGGYVLVGGYWPGVGAPGELEPCPTDLSGDGVVGSADLALLLGAWGECPAPSSTCHADLNNDGSVNSVDLALLLGSWGAC